MTRQLDNADLATLLHAASDRIRLAVFNSCESSSQAELACERIDAASGRQARLGAGLALGLARLERRQGEAQDLSALALDPVR
jgi:hypothetical protein